MAKRKPAPSPPSPPPAKSGLTFGNDDPPETTSAPQQSSYTVLARRYRPQQFSDLVGQEPVARALMNALESNRVAHAYLFTGARGVGKTSTARILAKALNCVHGPTVTPCDRCEICQSIAAGEDVDVLEIDGASNRRIEEIRDIRQNVQYRPSRSRYKIYIIDEVHMLTREAFNALLKTLEEPPAHVKFIFATTEVQKVPVTILSRCQRFDFAGISSPRIVERLRAVIAAEGREADDEALELIARRAGGSMRDAQSLLDQLLAFGADRLTAEQIHRLLGTAGDERVLALAAAVLEHDPKRALEALAQAAEEGVQLGELLDQLLDYWRDLMVLHCAGTEAKDLSVSSRHRETLSQQASALKLDTILAGLDILATAKSRLRGTTHGRYVVEMALVRLGRLDDLVSLSQLAQWLGQSARPDAASAREGRLAPSFSDPVKKKPVSAPEGSSAPTTIPLGPETLPQVWQAVLSQSGPILGRELEKAGLPAIFGPNTLVLRFSASYNAQRERCSLPPNVEQVERALRSVTGQACNLRIESAAGAKASTTQQPSEEAETSPSRYRRQRSEAMKEPLIRRAVEVLGAQLVTMDEGFGTSPAASSEPVETPEADEA
jgi:DNA polymerase-3 subunit gamma/tau